jgi:hypothetical protein
MNRADLLAALGYVTACGSMTVETVDGERIIVWQFGDCQVRERMA